MKLGQFSVSLTVKDIQKSKAFYEKLGFTAHEGCGSVEDKWLILQNEGVVIGLFQDMFEDNIMTFNPTDARAIESQLEKDDVSIATKTQGDAGPAHFIIIDPDGNTIMFDQHGY